MIFLSKTVLFITGQVCHNFVDWRNTMKSCITCKTDKPLEDYYRHPQMADGHLNKCKECVKAYQRDRCTNTDYERRRNALPHRVSARAKYRKTERGMEAARRGSAKWIENNPEKRIVHNKLNNAVRDGLIAKPESCSRCGRKSRIEGHHHDYTKPLDVEWLCKRCHSAEHTKEK
jgi:ribosomal protein S27AE